MARPLLRDFYAKKFEPLRLRSRRPNTKRLYRTTLNVFDEYLQRPAVLADLNDETVNAFAASRLDSGLSKFSVNKDLSNLLAIWRWAHRKGFVKNWPDVELESLPQITPVALTRDELAAVKAAIAAERKPVAGVAGPKFWLALFLLIWDTGERINAVMQLTWDRVDLSGGWVRFHYHDRKGGRADNLIEIADDTAAALAAIRRPAGKVFLWPYAPTYIFARFAVIMLRAGLPNSKSYKFHCLRKSMASHLKAAGGDPQRVLGHSCAKVTKAYIDLRIAPEGPSAVSLLFRPGT